MALFPMDMDVLDLPFDVLRELRLRLNVDNAWVAAAEYLITKGITLNIQHLKADTCPSEKLLLQLSTKNCNVAVLCRMFEDCELLSALALLKPPVPITILVQPGNGRTFLQVAYGGKFELHCKAYSLPPPLYQWYRDNTLLPGKTSCHLVVTDFSPELEGRYLCKVRADDYRDPTELCTQVVHVMTVPISPEITQQPEGVVKQEGETICLKCVAEAYPKPRYQWFRYNELLGSHTKSTLYINYAKAEHSGEYRCLVFNNAGEKYSEKIHVTVNTAETKLLKLSERHKAKEKLALLIGNVKYKNHDPLLKPVDDVVLLSYKLKEIGFKVITLVNLNLVEMRNAIAMFSERLAPDVYGVFYYGGHGIQTDERLMLPVDAPDSYGPENCISEKEVKDVMLSKSPSLRVIILDMCLKTPDRPMSPRKKLNSTKECDGKPDTNLVLAYSTSGNLSAYERRSEPTGTYIKYLSQYITQDMCILGVFQKTHEAIYNENMDLEDVAQQQIPMLSSNVYGNFCFTDSVTGDPDIEKAFNEIYIPPKSHTMQFQPALNIDPLPEVYFFRHRDCILNIVDIEVRGVNLKLWKIEVCNQKRAINLQDGHIKQQCDGEVVRITVEELQGREIIDNCDLSINLKDQEDCTVGSAPLPLYEQLYEPLIMKWNLWNSF